MNLISKKVVMQNGTHIVNIFILTGIILLLSGCDSNPIVKDSNVENNLIIDRQKAAKAYTEKNYKKALPMYENLIKKIPNDALLWHRLGNIHARENRPNQAILAYRKAVSFEPKLSVAWHNMGILELRQAANSFTQMLQTIQTNDPLQPRALKFSEGIIELLNNDGASN